MNDSLLVENENQKKASQIPKGKKTKLNKCPTMTVEATLLGST
jgi:hypothetical protein